MCIISGRVKEVSKTKIWVMPSKDGRLQLTIYSNKVAMAQDGGAMILPVPAGNVEFVDLADQVKLFDRLDDVFFPPPPMTMSANSYSAGRSKSIAVVQVGSYKASFLPPGASFSELSDVFKIDEQLLQFIGLHYDAHKYGFVVCQLDKNKTYHPFGYIHVADTSHLHEQDIHRLQGHAAAKRVSSKLFVPTMHYHEHDTMHDELSFSQKKRQAFLDELFSSPFNTESSSSTRSAASATEDKKETKTHGHEVGDWDHHIYFGDCRCETEDVGACMSHVRPVNSTVKTALDWQRMPANVKDRFAVPSIVSALQIMGQEKNCDLMAAALA